MHVRLLNDRTGAIKEIKVGFSWTLLIFSGVFGIPLFMRGLIKWGFTMFILSAMEIPQYFSDADRFGDLADGGGILGIIWAIFFGFVGNKITVLHLLKTGWRFADENDQVTEYAKAKWSIG